MVMGEKDLKVLNTYSKLPYLQVRGINDVYEIIEKTEMEFFYNYLNTASSFIKFTDKMEKSRQFAWLYINIQQLKDGLLATILSKASQYP